MTSHDVVAFIRRLFKLRRVGHTGTLDPGVAGVLPVCLGKATRIAQFLTDMDKAYRGELTLGYTTDTQDGFGQVTSESDAAIITEEAIRKTFAGFTGVIEQIPPMVSAVRHQGRKLYEFAREGREVERRPRQVTIHSLVILEIKGLAQSHPKVDFEVVCSKGTYIRTLCADIGGKLGVGGYMSHLIRIRSGPFTLDTAFSLEIIEQAVATGDYQQVVLPIDAGLTHLSKVIVRDSAVKAVAHGNALFEPGVAERPWELAGGQLVRLYDLEGNLLAVAKVTEAVEKENNCSKVIYQPTAVFV